MLELILQSTVPDRLGTWWSPVLLVLILATVAAAAYVVQKVVVTVLRSWTRRTKSEVDDVLVGALHPPALILLFLAGTVVALRLIPVALSDGTWAILRNVGRTLAIVAVGVAVIKLTTGFLRVPAKRNPRWFPLSTVGSRLAAATLWIIIGVLVLHQYGVEVTPLVATLGVAGIAVGLALQTTLQNFFAGLWIQSGENLRPGHFVRLESQKLEGFIEDVGWRTTRIRTLPGNLIIVPNQEMSTAIITNMSLPAEKMGTSIKFVVGFEEDPDRIVKVVLEEVQALAKEIDYVLTDPPPAARLNQAVDKGWEFWCGFWVAHYWDQWNAQGQMFRRLRARFLREGIRLALPIHEEYAVPNDRPDVRRSIVAVRSISNGQGHAPGTSGPSYEPPAADDRPT